jgi:mannose-6-phosphate isomerase
VCGEFLWNKDTEFAFARHDPSISKYDLGRCISGDWIWIDDPSCSEDPMSQVSIVTPRLDAKPWGGRRLERFGLTLPDGLIGEALVTAGDAVVSRGFGAGQTLDDLVAGNPGTMCGRLGLQAVGEKPIFPLLVKLIDASEDLSIQVHPDDTAAQRLGKLGKTEAWHVLAADDGAGLYVGLQPDTSFEEFQELANRMDGSSAANLRFVPAIPGSTMLIPAGTIHALGAGVIVYEIQQPSDVTYRLDDWGRVDALGNPREMHLQDGFAVSRPDLNPAFIDAVSLPSPVGGWDLLTACRYFALAHLTLAANEEVPMGWSDSPAVVTLLSGSLSIAKNSVAAGESIVLWPGDTSRIVSHGKIEALVSWVPDLPQDIVRPALRAGVDSAMIDALAGDTGDLAIFPGAA